MQTKATITLHVTYTGADANEATVKHLLQSMVEHAADRGQLTGGQNLTLDESDFEITIVDGDEKRERDARNEAELEVLMNEIEPD